MIISTITKPATPPTIPPTSTGVGGALLFPEPLPELGVDVAAVPVFEPPMPPAPTPVLEATLAADAEDWLAIDNDADASRVGVAVSPELRDWSLRVDVAKPLKVEAAAAIEEILAMDACDAVDCAKRNAMALDSELRALRLDDAAALESIEVAVDFISRSP
jgi:hypothetical protein